MKRLFCFICACLAGVIILGAQSRTALEDSVIIGGIPRSLVDMLLSNDEMTTDEKLLTQWTYAEFMKSVSREHLVIFSDQELMDILDFYRTDAYRFITSEAFYTTYIENISKAFLSELGQGAKFSYSLKDNSYGAGLEPIFESSLSSIRPVIDDMLDENGSVITNAKKYGMPDSQIALMKASLKTVLNNLYNIFKISVLDYLSKDALAEIDEFVRSQTGYNYFIYSQKINNAADIASDQFVNDFQAKMERNKNNTSRLKSEISDYVVLSRSFPEYLPELWRPYAELKIGDSQYQGQIRDLKPHGKGKLVDKKGVVYEGDFKNGKRHGILEVTKPGKQTVTQYWIEDRYRKEIPVGKNKDGTVPQAYVADGVRYGFGSVYDSEKRTRYQGIFTDGQLNGSGKVVEPNRSVEGEFVDGKFMNGVIYWDSENHLVVSFRGRMSGDLGNGLREWVSKDGSGREMHIGAFKKGLLEENGRKTIVFPNDVSEYSGVFAYGKLYGKGVQRHSTVDEKNGIRESSVYQGGFFADRFQGEGHLKISLTDIPAGSWTFTRCSVTLPEFQGDSLDIVMDGRFDDGSFKEGKITFSNGTWLEGEFADTGLAEGTMLLKYPDGSYYQGDCLGGRRHGYGEIHGPEGIVFKGKFEYDEPVVDKVVERPDPRKSNALRYDELKYEYRDLEGGYGKAILIKPAGVKIMVRSSHSLLRVTCKGRFRGETMIEGKVTMSDGNWLEGTFEDGILIQGKGKIVDKYLIVYEGDIRNGYPHGEGKCIYTDKTWFKGKFANGNRMGGTHYDADGKVIKVYE